MSQTNPNQADSIPVSNQGIEEMLISQSVREADVLHQTQVELTESKAKNADLADQFLRAKAEAENSRRRAEEEISKARKFALEDFAASLLPVVDSLETSLIRSEE